MIIVTSSNLQQWLDLLCVTWLATTSQIPIMKHAFPLTVTAWNGPATNLTHCPLGDVGAISKVWFWNSYCRIVAWALTAKVLSCEWWINKVEQYEHTCIENMIIVTSFQSSTMAWPALRDLVSDHFANPHNEACISSYSYSLEWSRNQFNPLPPGRCGSNFKSIILKFILQNSSLGTHCEGARMWMPQNLSKGNNVFW